MNVIKRLQNQQLFLQHRRDEIVISDLAQDGYPIQNISSVGDTALAWSNTTNHFVAVSSHRIRVYGVDSDRCKVWTEIASVAVHVQSTMAQSHVSFSYPMVYFESQGEKYLINVLTGEKRTVIGEGNKETVTRYEKLSKSSLYLMIEDPLPVNTPTSIDSIRSSECFSIYSLVPILNADTGGDVSDLSDLKKVEIDFHKISKSNPTSWTWHTHLPGTNYELLSVVFEDFSVAIYAVSHNCTVEEDGIMAIALNAVLTARSLNHDHDVSTLRIEEERQKLSITTLKPTATLVTLLEGEICRHMLMSSHSPNSSTSTNSNHTTSLFTTSWLTTSIDPAAMIEEDNDTSPIVSTSSKLALPPVVRKSKRVELTHQGYWLALMYGNNNELKIVTIRLGYDVPTMLFEFDMTSQVRARILYAHNSENGLCVQWMRRSCQLQAYFSANFRQLVALQSISREVLCDSCLPNSSNTVGVERANLDVDVLQMLYLRNKTGEFRKVMECNYVLQSSTRDTNIVRHMPRHRKEGSLLRLPSVAVLGLQQHQSLPKMYFLPIKEASCQHTSATGYRTITHSHDKGNTSHDSAKQPKYVLDESDFVLCGFDALSSVVDVYIRDPAYLSGASQLSPRPKASTSSLEEIHRGRYGSNPNIYFVDIIPDEQYGLGLRLDEEKDCLTGYIKVVINSFKSHPITNEPMAAELTCKIGVGDEIIGANTASFSNKSQSYVIQTMKSMLASNHGNILRLVMKRADKSSSSPMPSSSSSSNNHSDKNSSTNDDKLSLDMRQHSHDDHKHHIKFHAHFIDFKTISPMHVLSLHPLKAHVQLDISSLLLSSSSASKDLTIVDVSTIVVLDEVGQNEVTVFVLTHRNATNSTNNNNGFELYVFQLQYQPNSGHYVTFKVPAPYPLRTLRLADYQTTTSTTNGTANNGILRNISMVAHLLRAPESKSLSFSITISHPSSSSAHFASHRSSAHANLHRSVQGLQTDVQGQVTKNTGSNNAGDSSNMISLSLAQVVETCFSPIQHFLETFRIDQSVYSRCLEQYASMHSGELRRQAQLEITEKSLELLMPSNSNNNTNNNDHDNNNSDTVLSGETIRRRKEWSFLDVPVSVDVFAVASRFFTMSRRELQQTLETSLVDIISTFLQLQGHNVLYNVEAVDRQWNERNSNDAAQILVILAKRNYLGKFQDYVRSKLSVYVDYRAKWFVSEYKSHRHAMFMSHTWQYQCDHVPWMYLGELQATCASLFVMDHLAEVLKFASHVYLTSDTNQGFVQFLNASETFVNNPKDDWRLLSTLLVQGQSYLQLDGFAMNSILYAMTKRGYTSVFLHIARKLEGYKPDIFQRGKKKKAAMDAAIMMSTNHDGEDDYQRTLSTLAFSSNNANKDENNSSNNSSSLSNSSANAFGIGSSSAYEEKKRQREEQAFLEASANYLPMYASMTTVINAFFSTSQDALFMIFVDNFNILGREDDHSRVQMLLSLGKEVCYTPVSNDVDTKTIAPVPVWQHPSVDLLTYATRMKVSLWLHDLSPLLQLILRHALKQFKVHKNIMDIFLDLVIIGKTETLLQLARTDTSASGKQLMTLLAQVEDVFNPIYNHRQQQKYKQNRDEEDTSSSSDEEEEELEDEKTRIALLLTKLRKNADALVRKKRYREAAAVLLLMPTAQMIKAALNLLTFQYNAPFLAHLVSRCMEHRIYCHGEVNPQKLERHCLQEMYRSNAANITSRVGFYQGIYTTTLVEKDMLPDLWRTMDLAKRSSNYVSSATTTAATSTAGGSSSSSNYSQMYIIQEQERRNSAYYHLEGIPVLQTALVLALSTQKVALIQETFAKVLGCLEENLVFHPDSIGDFTQKIVLPSRNTDTTHSATSATSATTSATSSSTHSNQQTTPPSLPHTTAGLNNVVGGIWTGKLGIPPMLMHEIHVGLTKSCVHDFSPDDILIIQNALRVTYGQDVYRMYSFSELFLSLGVLDTAAQYAGKDNQRRFARFMVQLYSTLGMEQEALQYQATLHQQKAATTHGTAAQTSKHTRENGKITSKNGFIVHCERLRQDMPSVFQRFYAQLTSESAPSTNGTTTDGKSAVTAGTPVVPEIPKMSFNFSSSGNSKVSSTGTVTHTNTNTSASASAAAATNAKLPSSGNNTNRNTNNILDAFDFPPPVRNSAIRTTKSSASANASASRPVRNMLDDFDAPSVPVKASSVSRPVRNMLDDFDAPSVPVNASSVNRPVRNMLDDFDAPSVPVKASSVSKPVRNMLDDFDAPSVPVKASSVNKPVRNMLDDFDTPSVPVKASSVNKPVRNMLDDFDAPSVPIKASSVGKPVRNMLDDFDAPSVPVKASSVTKPVRNMLDDFDTPSVPVKASSVGKPVRNMLDDFDGAPTSNHVPAKNSVIEVREENSSKESKPAAVSATPPSALDIFDMPISRPARRNVTTTTTMNNTNSNPDTKDNTNAINSSSDSDKPEVNTDSAASVFVPANTTLSLEASKAADPFSAAAVSNVHSSSSSSNSSSNHSSASNTQPKSALDMFDNFPPARPARKPATTTTTTYNNNNNNNNNNDNNNTNNNNTTNNNSTTASAADNNDSGTVSSSTSTNTVATTGIVHQKDANIRSGTETEVVVKSALDFDFPPVVRRPKRDPPAINTSTTTTNNNNNNNNNTSTSAIPAATSASTNVTPSKGPSKEEVKSAGLVVTAASEGHNTHNHSSTTAKTISNITNTASNITNTATSITNNVSATTATTTKPAAVAAAASTTAPVTPAALVITPSKKTPPANPFAAPAAAATTTDHNTSAAKKNTSSSNSSSSAAIVNPFNNSSSGGNKSTEEKVRDFYRQYNPAKLSSVPEILAKYQGRETELLQKLQKQYGVTPNTNTSSTSHK